MELARMSKSMGEIAEKADYYENFNQAEQRKFMDREREFGGLQEKVGYMEKLVTQRDNEIEQLKQIIDDFTQKAVKRSTGGMERMGIGEKRGEMEKGNGTRISEKENSAEINYSSGDYFQRKDRSITPNPSFKKSDRPDLMDSRGFEYTKMERHYNYKKEITQESKAESKDRSVINFNNTMINSVSEKSLLF